MNVSYSSGTSIQGIRREMMGAWEQHGGTRGGGQAKTEREHKQAGEAQCRNAEQGQRLDPSQGCEKQGAGTPPASSAEGYQD